MRKLFSRSGLGRSRGTALVITLALVVLLAVVIVAFLARSMMNRQIEASGASRINADLLALSSLEAVVGDLRQEMLAGSTAATVGGITVMYPATRAAVLPWRKLAVASMETDTNFANLFKQSLAGVAFFPSAAPYGQNGATPLIQGASSVTTATASANGRIIGANRWNAPNLLSGGGFSSSNGLPAWIYVSRAGILPSQTWSSTWADSSETNDACVVGRFAYNVYFTGGLLDANVAGAPALGFSTAEIQTLKRSLAGIDLTNIPGITAQGVANLVAWRNAASAASKSAFLNYATNVGPRAGFIQPATGDHVFTSRQDLITYVTQQGGTDITTNALPFLTHFTRSLNVPSVSPATVTTTNVFAANVRFPATLPTGSTLTHYWLDGTTSSTPVKANEQFLRNRFPLSRLAWLGMDGPASGVTDDMIQKCFGLKWNPGLHAWDYVGPAGTAVQSKVETLGEVAAEVVPREPNFFELLQAAILQGSLGKTAGDPAVANHDTMCRTADIDVDMTLQVIRIGANIIDQYDADSYPTLIRYQSLSTLETYAGVENLPYINRVFDTAYRPNTPADPKRKMLGAWYEFEIWNPHQSATFVPAKLRIVGSGVSCLFSTVVVGSSTTTQNSAQRDLSTDYVAFDNAAFVNPTLLSQANSTCANPPAEITPLTISGLLAGIDNLPDKDLTGVPTDPDVTSSGALPQNFVSFQLQYQLPNNGPFVTYQTVRNLDQSMRSGASANYTTTGTNRSYIFKSDPRNVRFGAGKGDARAPGLTMRAILTPPVNDPADGRFCTMGYIASPGWTLMAGSSTPTAKVYMAALANNSAANLGNYKSPDGVLRLADAGLVPTLNPFATDPLSVSARPVMLNHAFNSVADMGYAFRDEPWKTLDFFTANSADAVLLDYFCVDDAPSLTAGKINPNTAHPEILKGLLSGAVYSEASNTTVPPAQITAWSAAATTMSAANQLRDLSDLVTQLASTDTNNYSFLKIERESCVRAMAPVSDTRTWNVLIDLVAQTGRFGKAVTSADRFTVEGEQHYWLHLAIDRYTGKVIAQQYEVVQE